MHAPLQTYSGNSAASNTGNRGALFQLLAGRPHLYSVAGHTHTAEHHYLDKEDGFPGPGTFHHHVLATVSGSWWSGPVDDRGIPLADQRDGTPNGYHILEVDGTHVTVRYKAAGKPANFQMRVMFEVAGSPDQPETTRDLRPGELLDSRIPLEQVPSTRILVNLFDGGPRSLVAFSINNREEIPMTRQTMVDPHTEDLFLRHEDTLKSWVKAAPSSHIFVADLPADLTAGTHTLTVRAVDEFGRTHHDHRILEIVGSSARGE
jgi:hypothetical protein